MRVCLHGENGLHIGRDDRESNHRQSRLDSFFGLGDDGVSSIPGSGTGSRIRWTTTPTLLLGQKLAAVAHAGTDVCAPAEPGRFVVGLPLLESSFETFGNFRVLAGEFFGLAYIVG